MDVIKKSFAMVFMLGSASVAQGGLILEFSESFEFADLHVGFDGLAEDDYVTGFAFTLAWEPENYVFDFGGNSLVALFLDWEVFNEITGFRECEEIGLGQCGDSIRVIARQTSDVTQAQRIAHKWLLSDAFGSPFPGALPLYDFTVGRYNSDGSYDPSVPLERYSFSNAVVYGENGRIIYSVPEPSTLALLGLALGGIGIARRRSTA